MKTKTVQIEPGSDGLSLATTGSKTEVYCVDRAVYATRMNRPFSWRGYLLRLDLELLCAFGQGVRS